jgi:hypothetical protein
MPQDPHNSQKATSPSPLMQRVIDQSWNQQNADSKTAQDAISKQYNKHPQPPGDTKATK